MERWRAPTGDLFFEFRLRTDKKNVFYGAVQSIVERRKLDSLMNMEEEGGSDKNVLLRSVNSGGQELVIVTVPGKIASKLVHSGRITVAWMIGRMR